ncbi:unnamed protein product [Durusdinium trenchii]|uniref:Uncharacterized protein n=1 Tax=Durusdinium trenchii TaxID=1381693 RepID=A0ABP0S202_9DINO
MMLRVVVEVAEQGVVLDTMAGNEHGMQQQQQAVVVPTRAAIPATGNLIVTCFCARTTALLLQAKGFYKVTPTSATPQMIALEPHTGVEIVNMSPDGATAFMGNIWLPPLRPVVFGMPMEIAGHLSDTVTLLELATCERYEGNWVRVLLSEQLCDIVRQRRYEEDPVAQEELQEEGRAFVDWILQMWGGALAVVMASEACSNLVVELFLAADRAQVSRLVELLEVSVAPVLAQPQAAQVLRNLATQGVLHTDQVAVLLCAIAARCDPYDFGGEPALGALNALLGVAASQDKTAFLEAFFAPLVRAASATKAILRELGNETRPLRDFLATHNVL